MGGSTFGGAAGSCVVESGMVLFWVRLQTEAAQSGCGHLPTGEGVCYDIDFTGDMQDREFDVKVHHE